MRHHDGSSGAGSIKSKPRVRVFTRLTGSVLYGASLILFQGVNDRHGLSSLWWRHVSGCSSIFGIVSVSLGPMLFLHVILNEASQHLPDGVEDHGWRRVFNNCTVFKSGSLGVGRYVVLFTFSRILDFPVRLVVFTLIRSSVKLFFTVSIEIIEINPDHLSTELVVVLINQLDVNLQGHLIELTSSSDINRIVHKGNVILILGSSHSRGKHPLEFRLEGMSVVFPLVLPPGELFFSYQDHLSAPV